MANLKMRPSSYIPDFDIVDDKNERIGRIRLNKVTFEYILQVTLDCVNFSSKQLRDILAMLDAANNGKCQITGIQRTPVETSSKNLD